MQIIKNILNENGLLNQLEEDEYEFVVGNQKKAIKIPNKPILGEDYPDFWEKL